MGSTAEKGLEEALGGQLGVAEVQQHYNRSCLSAKKQSNKEKGIDGTKQRHRKLGAIALKKNFKKMGKTLAMKKTLILWLCLCTKADIFLVKYDFWLVFGCPAYLMSTRCFCVLFIHRE